MTQICELVSLVLLIKKEIENYDDLKSFMVPFEILLCFVFVCLFVWVFKNIITVS